MWGGVVCALVKERLEGWGAQSCDDNISANYAL